MTHNHGQNINSAGMSENALGVCGRQRAKVWCLVGFVLLMTKSIIVDQHLVLVDLKKYSEPENRKAVESVSTNYSQLTKGEAFLSQRYKYSLERERELDHLVESLARPFKPWQGVPHEWCVDEHSAINKTKMRGMGLLFARTFKTGSTSAAAVHLQIAHRVGQRMWPNQNKPCHFHYKHTWSQRNGMKFKTTPSRLWTIVRDPSQRSLSAYNYYMVGQKNRTWNANNLQRFLRGSKNHQTMQLRTNRTHIASGGGQPARKVEPELWKSTSRITSLMQSEILGVYDFIAVNERWDESMAVLQLLWGLQEEDMMYIGTKASTSWTYNWSPRNTCFWIPPKPAVDSATSEFLRTSFRRRNLDVLLHRLAWRSLDLTIQSLGTSRVQEVIDRQSRMRAYVQGVCNDYVTFPCSATGHWQPTHAQDCYKNDIYCGHKCLNSAIDQYLAIQ